MQIEKSARLLGVRFFRTNAYQAPFASDWLHATGTHITSNDQKNQLLCADEELDTETGQKADEKDRQRRG